MDSSCDMPEHLLFDILLWLPVTILLRFKSVCKSWYTLIDSSTFIAQHFDHNSGNDNLLGVCLDVINEGLVTSCLLSGNKYEVYNNFDCGQAWHFVEETKQAFSSNGIICLVKINSDDVALWNPATKQLRSIPKPPTSCENLYTFFGFGFNVKSNDHIYVRTAVFNENPSTNLVQVYSLRTDSWRSMHKDFAIPFRFYQCVIHQITKNGTCFWITSDDCFYDDETSNVILSFDLNEETYETMPLPVEEVPFSAIIDFLGDKLAYIHGVDQHEFKNGHSYYEIWVLHEYGVKESWNKIWKIGPTDIPSTSEVLFPLSFIKNGELLLLGPSTNQKTFGVLHLYILGTEENEYIELQQPNLVLCEQPNLILGTEEKEYFELELERPELIFYWCVSYTESLVSVKRVNDAY